MTSRTLLAVPGDGIGPEVTASAIAIVGWFNAHREQQIVASEDAIGGAAYDRYGIPLHEETLAQARESDIVLLGAVGGPQYSGLPYDLRPEAGLLSIRSGMGLYANIRPVLCFDELVKASTLKPEILRGTDMVFVRELASGVYFGSPRGIQDLPEGGRRGINTHSYTTAEIQRVSRIAFKLASQRSSRVTSLDKANVMEAGLLWREEVQALRDAEFETIALTHMLADNAAMQLVRNPTQFDVILTDNLFGDILSDEAAMLTGSLGMLPSASLGCARDGKGRAALYEPIHGSAPDIAGRDIANPLAMLLSLAMALRISLDRSGDADQLEGAIRAVLRAGHRTRDLPPSSGRVVGTKDMTALVIAELDRVELRQR